MDDLTATLADAFFVTVTYANGASGNLPVEITADGRWHLEAPEGAVTVAGLRVQPGDTASGAISVS